MDVFRAVEFLFLFMLCRILGNVLRAKRRSAFGLQLLLVVLWYGGQLVGQTIALLMQGDIQSIRPDDVVSFTTLMLSLFGSFCGAVLCFLIANARADKCEKDEAESEQ